MAEENVFDRLAKELNTLPNEIQEIYEDATKQEIRVAGNTLRKNLIRGAGKNTRFNTLVQKLNERIYEKETFIKGQYYEVEVDWTDERLVNTDLGLGYGKYAHIPRARKKRNYSIRPATYKDLAYIINYGRGANFSQSNEKVIAGNYFVQKAVRSIKKWRIKRDLIFRTKLDILANKKFEK
jgi:hypothetical protein